jgi:hypothetical protein
MKSQLAFVLFAFAMGCGDGANKATPVEKSEAVVTKDVFEPDLDVEDKPIKKSDAVSEVAPLPTKYADAFELGKALVDKGEHPRAREML